MSTWGKQVSGRHILNAVKQQLENFKPDLQARQKKIAIIHFGQSDAPPQFRTFVDAASISTRAKIKTFRDLGVEPIDISKSWETSADEFEAIIDELNRDQAVTGIIVQHPMSIDLSRKLSRIAPEKDIDALSRRSENLFQLPATSDAIARTAAGFTQADAISRLVTPYAPDQPLIAVVGARGFVGSGVVELLKQQNARILPIDARDKGFTPEKLLEVRTADIVISTTGRPEILDERHICPHHRVIIDCGFSPTEDQILGDVKRSAYGIPQNITPVPGGIGPTEMAILAERVIQKEVAPQLEPWQIDKQPFLSREQVQQIQGQWADNIIPTIQTIRSMQPDDELIQGERYTIHTQPDSISLLSHDARNLILQYERFNPKNIQQNNLNNQDFDNWSRTQQLIESPSRQQNNDPER